MDSPPPAHYGKGVFRRRYLLRASDGCVRADMEDDFHRFALELLHDGHTVSEVRGVASRYPWTECPGAVVPLRALRGMPLTTDPTAPAEHTNPRTNCTHLFDLATLAITHAAAGRKRRLYDITIPDRVENRTRVTLDRDGERVLEWEVEGVRVTSPAPFEGLGLMGRGFLRWVAEELDHDLAQAAVALRRACFIAMGRARDLDEAASASDYLKLARNSCHSFSDGIAERAIRVRGSTWDFSDTPERLLASLESGDVG